MSSLTIHSPLEIIYTDVWGPAFIESINQNKYFVIFLDHFTKFIWLYPIKYKYDVFTIFPPSKILWKTTSKPKSFPFIRTVGVSFKNSNLFLQNLASLIS